jgi:hypothetical protein
VALVGCSGTPAGPTLAPGQTATPAPPTLAPGATATPAPPVGLTGHECDAVPTFDINNPQSEPSFPPDTAAEAHITATIDGQPVHEIHSQQWLYFLCYLGGQASLEQAAGQAGGINMATSSFAQGTAEVDGSEVDLTAWRTPGADSHALVQYLSVLAAQSGTDIVPTDVQETNVGGKAVFTWAGDDGSKSYAYPSGDTLVFFENVTDSQATKILSALP